MKNPTLVGPKLLAVIGALAVTCSVRAAIVGPYTADANTLHLWHLNESATPALDTGSDPVSMTSLANGAALGSNSYSGFGTALSTLDGGQDFFAAADKNAVLSAKTLASSTADNQSMLYAGASGAFTWEAIVHIEFDPYKLMGTVGNGRIDGFMIISGDNDAAPRIFQWVIYPAGAVAVPGVSTNFGPVLEFVTISPSVWALDSVIPTNGPNAIVSNNWYHVAVTYDGNEGAADNLKVYWTLMDPSRTNANLIDSNSMPADLITGASDFCIGNEGRTTASGNFLGLVDEVRMSNIARGPNAMMFADTSITVLTGPEPTNQVVNVGQPASFALTVSGAPPLFYQWRTNGVRIPGATNSSYTIASAQLANAGSYTVVITNTFNISVTSSVATLTVQTPLNLTWLGQTTADWDLTTTNWLDSLANNQNFLSGDGVTFDAAGSGQPTVSLNISVAPSNMVVDASTDYTISGSGTIAGPAKLTKKNTGTLILDVNSTHTGGTEIQSGIVQVGNNAARGSLGSGAISNGTAIVFNRSDTALTLSNNISGPGSLTNNCTTVSAIVTLAGSNTFTGDIMINSGMLTLGSTNALGNCTNITVLNPTVNGAYGTRLGLSGVTIGTNVGITMYSGFGGRASIYTESGTNIVNTPVFLIDQSPGLDLTTYNLATVGAGTRLVMNGAITTATFDGTFLIRGGGTVVINAPMILPSCDVAVTSANTWILNSTGNSWEYSEIASGSLIIGANNALPVTIPLLTASIFDLAGYNQQLESLQDYNGNTSGVVGNSSTTSDSLLTIVGTSNVVYNGVIRDVIGTGTRKVGLTLNGGFSYTLSGNCNYSGDTTVLAGTLALTAAGAITNTATINLAAGTTLDVSTRNDATLTLKPGQTLKGNAEFNVTGNLTNRGTIELKLNKAGATLTNDSIHGLTSIDYGGTLKLTITASPALTTSDSFPLFFASAYSGAFTSLVPSVPAFGLAWDTSTLATDGTLRIMAGPNTTPTNITSAVSGNTLTLSWPSDHTGWRLQAQTNSRSIGVSNNWFDVAGSTTTNLLILPIDQTKGTIFFRMIYP